LNSLNKKYQERHKDYPDTGKDKNIAIKIKCLEQTARNSTAFYSILRQKNIDVKMLQLKNKWRNF